MNKRPLTEEQSTSLEQAQQLFENWRKNRTGRPRIPDNLWHTATDLYNIQGININKITRSLRLNHTALKEKIGDRTHPAEINPPANDESSMFIEIAPSPECSDCVIEVENQTGVKIRMCFRGRADPALISLGKYLLTVAP
ncbi:MAG: hypothetical protein GY755_02225 [Chloroflexi bacterium]|nr:hypothetical protein [Chloroflexota bacterium]